MSSAVVGALRVNLSVNSAEFTAGMQRAQSSLGGFKKFLGPLAASLSAGAVARGFDSAISKLDEIGKTADRLGLTTDALQELRSAAGQSGVATAQLDMAMQRFGRRLAEARLGAGEAKNALAEMGIALVDGDGAARSMEDVLDDVADAMQGMSSQTDRNRLAMKLFDSRGVALVNMLRDGAEGLDKMKQAARDMNGVVGEDGIRAAEDLRNEIDLLTNALGNTFLQAAGAASRAITDFFSIGANKQLQRAQQGLEMLLETRRSFNEASSVRGQEHPRAGALDDAISKRLDEIAELQKLTQTPLQPLVIPIETSVPTAMGASDAETALERQRDAYDNALRSLTQMNEGLQDEVVVLGMSGEARREYQAGVDAMSLAIEASEGLTAEQAASLRHAAGEVAGMATVLREATEGQQMLEDATRGVTDALTQGIQQASSFADGLKLVAARLVDVAINSKPVQDGLSNLIGSVLSGAASGVTGGTATPAFAAGTSFAPGGLALVGERGPELVDLPRGSRVYPNGQGPAGGQSIHIDARGASDPAMVEAAVRRGMAAVGASIGPKVRDMRRRGEI